MPISLGAALTGASVISGALGGRSAKRRARKANRLAKRAQAIRSQRERINALRSVREQRAQVEASAAGSGVLNSSGVQGALGAQQSSLNANIGVASQLTRINSAVSRLTRKAQGDIDRANLIGTLPGLATAFGVSDIDLGGVARRGLSDLIGISSSGTVTSNIPSQ